MAYSFYLDGMLLPVTPEKLEMKIKARNKTMTLINGEEINIPKAPGLTEISFEAMFPNIKYDFAVYTDGFLNAKYYIGKLEELKKKTSFPLRILRELPSNEVLYNTEKDMDMTLEEYEIKESADQGFDVMVAIKLKQFIKYGTALQTAEVVQDDKGDLFAAPKAERPCPGSSGIAKCLCSIGHDFKPNLCRYGGRRISVKTLQRTWNI